MGRHDTINAGQFNRYYNKMVSWNEAKRLSNLRVHGLDFIGCEAIFDGPVLTQEDSRTPYGEPRFNVIGFLHGMVVHLTYAEYNDELRVISLRKATRHEIQFFAHRLSH